MSGSDSIVHLSWLAAIMVGVMSTGTAGGVNMILGITFLGEERRPLRHRVALWASYVGGGAAGGAAAVTGLWIVAAPLRTFMPLPAVWTLAGAICVACLLADLGVLHTASSKRQVPPSWYRRFGPLRAFAMYGSVLGPGLFTVIPYAATYALYAFSTLVLPFPEAVVAGALHGGGRTILAGPVSVFGGSRLGSLGTTGLAFAYRAFPRLSAAVCVAYLVTLSAAWPS